jgi:predicted small lipoprotein YifL
MSKLPIKLTPAPLVLLLLAALAGCGLLREPLPTPRPTTVARVTADQVAQAMDSDQFYATYGQTALLIEGSVASVDPQPDHFIVTLATGVHTKVQCDLGNRAPPIKAGDTITVRSADPEHDVSRQDAAMMIRNCAIP